jgi:two-component sensor histidine kinase
VIIIGYFTLFKHIKQAKYFVAGWTLLLISLLLMALNRVGIIGFEIPYLMQIGIFSEALLFSIGLAERIRYLKEEKEQADKKLFDQQKREKETLEMEVNERTKELVHALDEKGVLLKEVHHRVKNNLQIIISLLRLQTYDIKNEVVQIAMTESENRIKAMSRVHELLYNQENFTEIDVEHYFYTLMSEAQRSFDPKKKIIISVEAKAKISMEVAIYCGLIVNELVTNAFKYAFGYGTGKIGIEFKEEKNGYVLIVADNGKGADFSVSSNSLGIKLVSTLVKKQLKGELSTDTTNGTKFTIIFSEQVNV